MGMLTVLKSLSDAHSDGIWALSTTKAPRTPGKLLTASVDETLKLWSLDGSNNVLSSLGNLEPSPNLSIISVDINPANSSQALSTSLDSTISIYDLSTLSLTKKIEAGPMQAWSTCFSPEGRFIATTTSKGSVNLFNPDTGTKESTFETRSPSFALCVQFSPNGLLVAASTENGSVHVWDVGTGKLLHSLPGHAMGVRTLSFTADSSILVTGGDDKRINMYDV
ncbi:WD repeat-containing protein 61 [Chytridiales sp. JEL 0842]|nr:WD repeat-containing protein 61 [Chytridiales sp. JEL 0842]